MFGKFWILLTLPLAPTKFLSTNIMMGMPLRKVGSCWTWQPTTSIFSWNAKAGQGNNGFSFLAFLMCQSPCWWASIYLYNIYMGLKFKTPSIGCLFISATLGRSSRRWDWWKPAATQSKARPRHLCYCERVYQFRRIQTKTNALYESWRCCSLSFGCSGIICLFLSFFYSMCFCGSSQVLLVEHAGNVSLWLQGIIGLRPVSADARTNWRTLASVFQNLLGGSDATRRASTYLNQLANDSLPREEVAPLPWHQERPELDVVPVASPAPHECVIAVLTPSVPLRVVWRRNRR